VLLSALQLGALEVRLAMACALDVAEGNRMLSCISIMYSTFLFA
jgi:hypothetical protein